MSMLLLSLACSVSGDAYDLIEPAPTDELDLPTDTDAPVAPARVAQDRHWDCAGLDPADAAPFHKQVALTFDDGPDGVVTPQIVALLQAEGIPATFFMLGVQFEDPDNWAIVDTIAADPLFTIANHGYTHSALTSLSIADMEAEFDETNDLLLTFSSSVDFFRFPYGLSDCDAVQRVRSRGMHVTGWHVDTVDWCYGADDLCTIEDYFRIPDGYQNDMVGFTMEQIDRFDGGIVLMHDIHQSTADALPELIQQLRDGGYSFTSLDDAAVWPNLLNDSPVDLPFLGESCNPVVDRCWQIEYSSWCAPVGDGSAGICVLPCEGTCPDRPGAATTFCQDTGTGAGECVGRAGPINDWCERLPGTSVVEANRFVGHSSASPLSLDVCR